MRIWFPLVALTLIACEDDASPPPVAPSPAEPGRTGLVASEVTDAQSASFTMDRGTVTIAPQTASKSTSFTLVSTLAAEETP